ncbi:MAG: tRNA N6-adenosine threonylcarbamoyltransferase [Clostridiales bacterium]|jgi:N6-L-threonylcarbamoyladenine synthase|nr:tRNA N6-adenosine threonylcarbamoyltransferase [Clostridiales bacterium]MDK2932514.1 tRNA N6-adenosine threonylcarbamoyltransferase [Clostridiales bacterium]
MDKTNCLVLGIETSCDETSAAVVENGRKVLSNVISSQIDIHQKYGGVVPEIASRKHVEIINIVIQDALDQAGVTFEDIDVIGVTYGPGLIGALLVGVSTAKALAFALDKPLVGVHHIEGHIAANYLEHQDLQPPYVCLVASGGHSHIVYVQDYNHFKILGQTRDDAAGEAFDKVARVIGLGYPGGPLIDQIAKEGNEEAVNFPRVSFEDGSLDFSFSGVKTAVLNHINKLEQKGETYNKADIAASFQRAVVEVLVDKTITAAKNEGVDVIALAGGVAANSALRKLLMQEAKHHGFKVKYPSPILCTDNAAMIACAAYYEYISAKRADLDLNAVPNLRLGESVYNGLNKKED